MAQLAATNVQLQQQVHDLQQQSQLNMQMMMMAVTNNSNNNSQRRGGRGGRGSGSGGCGFQPVANVAPPATQWQQPMPMQQIPMPPSPSMPAYNAQGQALSYRK
eukprot:15106088-Ditylum_brightwellii.AAC.1